MQNGFQNQYKNTGVTIQDVVTYCRENFDRIWDDENYKWQSIKYYQNHREALFTAANERFAEVLAESFKGAANLLVGSMYYPYRMLCKFAELNPVKVRGMLGDQDKAEGKQFVKAIEVNRALFGSKAPDLDDEYCYMVDPAAFEQIEAYQGI